MFTLMGPGLDVNVDFIAVWKAAKQAHADRQPWERPTAAGETRRKKEKSGGRTCVPGRYDAIRRNVESGAGPRRIAGRGEKR